MSTKTYGISTAWLMGLLMGDLNALAAHEHPEVEHSHDMKQHHLTSAYRQAIFFT